MIVYAVFRTGVYRHECGGVYSHKDKAIEVARVLIAGEPDNHHHYQIQPVDLDQMPQSRERGQFDRYDACFSEMEPIAYLQRHRDGRVKVSETLCQESGWY